MSSIIREILCKTEADGGRCCDSIVNSLNGVYAASRGLAKLECGLKPNVSLALGALIGVGEHR